MNVVINELKTNQIKWMHEMICYACGWFDKPKTTLSNIKYIQSFK